MSSEQSPPDTSPSPTVTMTTRTVNVQTNPKVVPSQFTSTFVDKAMIAIDESAQVVTMTLLQRHLHPQVSPNGWILSEENWEVVGELKMPLNEMNALAIYFISEMTGGMNVVAAIQQYLKEHPRMQKMGINYGPVAFEVTDRPPQK